MGEVSEIAEDGLTLHLTQEPVGCLAAAAQACAEMAKQQAVEMFTAHLAAGNAAQRRMRAAIALHEQETGVALVQPGVSPATIKTELEEEMASTAQEIQNAMNSAVQAAQFMQVLLVNAQCAYDAMRLARELGPEVTTKTDPDAPMGPRAV